MNSNAMKGLGMSALNEAIKASATPVPLRIPAMPDTKSPQEYAFISLVREIKRFEDELGDDEVVAALLASFGQSVTIHIHTIKRAGQFFCIEGTANDGQKATLLQHYTQASFLLLKASKLSAEVKRPIGFLE